MRAEDGYEVVVEAGRDNFLNVEVRGDILAALRFISACCTWEQLLATREDVLEHLVLINNLDAMLVSLP